MQDVSTDNQGIGVLEILISLMVITSAVTAIILLVFGNQNIRIDNELANNALYRAAEITENARVLSIHNFNSVISSSSVSGIFQEDLAISDISPCRKNVTGALNWYASPLRPQKLELITSLTSIKESARLGNDCNADGPENNWKNLQTRGSFDFSPSGIQGTDIDYIASGSNKYAILTTQHSLSSTNDILIVDVTDAASPFLVSTADFSPAGFNAVDAAENYAFAANDTSSGQLQIIDITDLTAPVIVASRSLPGVGSSYPQGREIFYYNKRVYVGTWETLGHEFHIFDVSNPSNPVHLGSRQLNHSVRDIYVREELLSGVAKTIAYLASSVTSPTAPELIILDVTNPASIVPAGSFNAPGERYGTALYVLGNKLYLGRRRGTSTEHDFFILDISNHGVINVLGSKFLDLNPSPAEVSAIIVSANLAFLGTTDSNEELQVWDVTEPTDIHNYSKFNFPAKVTGLEFGDDLVYASIESNETLRIIFDNP